MPQKGARSLSYQWNILRRRRQHRCSLLLESRCHHWSTYHPKHSVSVSDLGIGNGDACRQCKCETTQVKNFSQSDYFKGLRLEQETRQNCWLWPQTSSSAGERYYVNCDETIDERRRMNEMESHKNCSYPHDTSNEQEGWLQALTANNANCFYKRTII